MSCADDTLIYDAVKESQTYNPIEIEASNPVIFMSFLASECCKTPKQVKNAKAYIQAHVDSAFDCNMTEAGNKNYES
jgi:hypothetical protein